MPTYYKAVMIKTVGLVRDRYTDQSDRLSVQTQILHLVTWHLTEVSLPIQQRRNGLFNNQC